MSRLMSFSLCVVMSMIYTQVQAETVMPLKGQDSQQIQLDINDCRSVAAITSSPPPSEDAAVDATQVRGRQHDEFYEPVEDDVKQHYHGCLQGRGYQVTP